MRLQLDERDPAFQALERWDAGDGLINLYREGQERLICVQDDDVIGRGQLDEVDMAGFEDVLGDGSFVHRLWREQNAADGAGRSADGKGGAPVFLQ
jgi:hypothetical protein